jgi:hypothetical protein
MVGAFFLLEGLEERRLKSIYHDTENDEEKPYEQYHVSHDLVSLLVHLNHLPILRYEEFRQVFSSHCLKSYLNLTDTVNDYRGSLVVYGVLDDYASVLK